MSKPDRDSETNYANPRSEPCPGYGPYAGRCGVNTPFGLCRFCTKTLNLEIEAKREKR